VGVRRIIPPQEGGLSGEGREEEKRKPFFSQGIS